MAKKNQQLQRFDIAESDRISKLPDPILCHILSFLPTKSSVNTCCLSKRWRFTWTSVAVLDLSDQSFRSIHIPKRRRTSACVKSFKNFVNMVLILRSHPVLQRFRLKLNNAYSESDVHSWIFSALTHNVQELSIHSMIESVNLPRITYNCGTLTALKVDSKIELNVPESVHLPSLKVIHLQDIPTLCNSSITRLLSGSPVLEELMIHRHDEDESKTFTITSNSLKVFVLKNPEYSENHYGILIDAPKLETFELIEQQVEIEIEFRNTTSLGKATFSHAGSLCREENIRTRALGSWKLQNVKVLSMPLILLYKVLPLIQFHNLTKLMLRYCGHDYRKLPRILTKLPILQVLILKKASCYQDHKATSDAWKKEKLAIGCLKNSLKRLQIEGFQMRIEDVEIVEYFVQNARFLNEIRLLPNRYHSESEKAALRKLLTLPRCSDGFKFIIC